MKIGELAKRSGLSPSRIRFYESVGLLKAVQRQPNGYRTYPDQAVLVLAVPSAALAQTPAGEQRRFVDMADHEILSFGPDYAAIIDALGAAIYAPQSGAASADSER